MKRKMKKRIPVFLIIPVLLALILTSCPYASAEGEASICGLNSSELDWPDWSKCFSNFKTTDYLYAGGCFGYRSDKSKPSCPDGCGGRIYVVNHQETWTNGDLLEDVSGGFETLSWNGSCFYTLAWSALETGTYDLILDLNVSGTENYYVWTDIYDPGVVGGPNITDQIEPINVTGPEIRIVKTAFPTEGVPGTNVTFTIVVENRGDEVLDPVEVVDTLPAGMAYDRDNSSGNESSPGTITWDNVGQLDPGDTIKITLDAWIRSNASGTLTNFVTVNGTIDGTTPSPSEMTTVMLSDVVTDNDTADVDVLMIPNISKTPDYPRNAAIGESVNFTIFVDLSNATPYNVTVNDTLPRGFIYNSSSFRMVANNSSFSEAVSTPNNGSAPVHVNWTLGNVTNSNITINFNATIANVPGNQNGTVLNNSVIFNWVYPTGAKGNVSDESGNITITEPDLQVNKSANASVVEAGDHVNKQHRRRLRRLDKRHDADWVDLRF
jgi:uncharacterized repeat protein (TIGR01451 family)/fimbrial isopeptide formation D2 family protein